MIGSVVRIGNAPADLMQVERTNQDKTQFYGTHAHGHLVSAGAKEIAIASREDMQTWEAWEFKRAKPTTDESCT